MNVEELIEKLTKIKEEHGNLPVKFEDSDGQLVPFYVNPSADIGWIDQDQDMMAHFKDPSTPPGFHTTNDPFDETNTIKSVILRSFD